MIAGSRRAMVQIEPINIDRHDDAADEQEAAMIDSFIVQHCEHVSQRSFEAVVAAFEAELGSVTGLPMMPVGLNVPIRVLITKRHPARFVWPMTCLRL